MQRRSFSLMSTRMLSWALMKSGWCSQEMTEMKSSKFLFFSHNSQWTGSYSSYAFLPRISQQHKVPCNNTSRRFYSVVRRFPYLVEQKPEDGDEDAQAAKIDWKIIEEDVDKPFVASGLEFVPLPVTFSPVNLCFAPATCLPPGVVT